MGERTGNGEENCHFTQCMNCTIKHASDQDIGNLAMGWNYALQWLIVLPLEIVAASITVDYWNPGVSNAALMREKTNSASPYPRTPNKLIETIITQKIVTQAALIKVIAVIGFM
jgi:L-asparagine transporter-like permease